VTRNGEQKMGKKARRGQRESRLKESKYKSKEI
jgi:hypothetical protein